MDDKKTRSFVFYLSLAIVGGVALAGLTIPQPLSWPCLSPSPSC